MVQFAETNTASIHIDQQLVAEEFILPHTGIVRFSHGGIMKIVDHKSKEKTDCECNWIVYSSY